MIAHDSGSTSGTAIVEDISERKSAEAVARQQELLLRSADPDDRRILRRGSRAFGRRR